MDRKPKRLIAKFILYDSISPFDNNYIYVANGKLMVLILQ